MQCTSHKMLVTKLSSENHTITLCPPHFHLKWVSPLPLRSVSQTSSLGQSWRSWPSGTINNLSWERLSWCEQNLQPYSSRLTSFKSSETHKAQHPKSRTITLMVHPVDSAAFNCWAVHDPFSGSFSYRINSAFQYQ